MTSTYEMTIWPLSGWLGSGLFIPKNGSFNIDRSPDGFLLQSENTTWLDNEGGLVCTCGESKKDQPCRHGLEILGLNEIFSNAIRNQIPDADRNRNGLYIDTDEWTNALINSIQRDENLDQTGMIFQNEYIFPLGVMEERPELQIWGATSLRTAEIMQSIISKKIAQSGQRIWLPETAMSDILDLSHAGLMNGTSGAISRYLAFANREKSNYNHPEICGKLDPAQLEGAEWLSDAFDHSLGVILADQMGVGKTLQIIAHIQSLKERRSLVRAMIAVPAGAVDHWINEIRRFTPDLDVIAWEGRERGKLEPILDSTEIVVTTHRTLVVDSHKLRKLDWSVLAVDEAQDAKNPESDLAVACALLPAFQKIPVTATPVENSLVDLHTLMTIAAPGLLGRQAHFRRDVADPVKKDEEGSEEILRKLHAIVAPFIKHRTQESAGLSIPKPNISRIILDLQEDQAAYEFIRDKAKEALNGEDINIFHQITLLRQAAADYRLITGKVTGESSTKTDWIAESVARRISEGRQVLLFSTWTGQLDLIRKDLIRRGAKQSEIGRIDGAMTRKQKRYAEADFKQGSLRLLEITMKAGGRSLNLPEADDVILSVPWWNPAVMMQAAYRAIRRGQKKTINVDIPIMKNTIEERLMEIQDIKARMSTTILQPASGSGGLTRKQLIGLINDS